MYSIDRVTFVVQYHIRHEIVLFSVDNRNAHVCLFSSIKEIEIILHDNVNCKITLIYNKINQHNLYFVEISILLHNL